MPAHLLRYVALHSLETVASLSKYSFDIMIGYTKTPHSGALTLVQPRSFICVKSARLTWNVICWCSTMWWSELPGWNEREGAVMCDDGIALTWLNLWREAATPESSISSTCTACDYSAPKSSSPPDRVCASLFNSSGHLCYKSQPVNSAFISVRPALTSSALITAVMCLMRYYVTLVATTFLGVGRRWRTENISGTCLETILNVNDAM